jgi:hypothetical protein
MLFAYWPLELAMPSYRVLTTFLNRAAVIAVFALGFSGSASATFVVAEWDPAFGAPFSNLGWRGSLTADIPDTCTSQSFFGQSFTIAPNCPTPWSVVDARVQFYSLADTAPVPATTEELDFTSLTRLLVVYRDSAGEVEGWTTYFTGARLSGNDPAALQASGVANLNAWFALQLTYSLRSGETEAVLRWNDNDPTACINALPPITSVLSSLFNFGSCFEGRSDPSNRAVATFRVVPAPGTLALVSAALGLAGAVTRRRRNIRG